MRTVNDRTSPRGLIFQSQFKGRGVINLCNIFVCKSWEDKAGSWTFVPAKYVALTKNKTFANILFNKLQEKQKIIQILNWMLLLRL